MTDMTAGQRFISKANAGIAELDRMVAQHGDLGGTAFFRIEFSRSDLVALCHALSAPRVPEEWHNAYEVLGWAHAFFCVALDDGIDPRNIEVGEIANKMRRQLLTAAPAPADVTLTNEGDIPQVSDSDELTKLRERVKVLEGGEIKALEAAAEDALALSQAAFSGSQESLRMQMAHEYLVSRIDRLREESTTPAPADNRPENCRNRLRDEGKPYPKSGCSSCSNGGLMGCPHELARLQERVKVAIEGMEALAAQIAEAGIAGFGNRAISIADRLREGGA